MKTTNRNPDVRRVSLHVRRETRTKIHRLASALGVTPSQAVTRALNAEPQERPAAAKSADRLAWEREFEQRAPHALRYLGLIRSADPRLRDLASEIGARNRAEAEAGERKARRSLGRAAWLRRNSFDEVEAILRVRLEASDWGVVGNVAAELGTGIREAVSALVTEAVEARRAKQRAEGIARMEAALAGAGN